MPHRRPARNLFKLQSSASLYSASSASSASLANAGSMSLSLRVPRAPRRAKPPGSRSRKKAPPRVASTVLDYAASMFSGPERRQVAAADITKQKLARLVINSWRVNRSSSSGGAKDAESPKAVANARRTLRALRASQQAQSSSSISGGANASESPPDAAPVLRRTSSTASIMTRRAASAANLFSGFSSAGSGSGSGGACGVPIMTDREIEVAFKELSFGLNMVSDASVRRYVNQNLPPEFRERAIEVINRAPPSRRMTLPSLRKLINGIQGDKPVIEERILSKLFDIPTTGRSMRPTTELLKLYQIEDIIDTLDPKKFNPADAEYVANKLDIDNDGVFSLKDWRALEPVIEAKVMEKEFRRNRRKSMRRGTLRL